MKRILLLALGSSFLYASEIKHGVSASSKHRVEPYFYINMGPLFDSAIVNDKNSSASSRASLPMNISTHPSHQTTYIHSVSLSGVKKCLRTAIYAYNNKLEQAVNTFDLEVLKAQKRFVMDQLDKHSLSIDERVVYSKQIELLIHHYNSLDMQSFITVVETDSYESAEAAFSYLKSRYQMGAFGQDAMKMVEQAYYNRPEVVAHEKKAENVVHEFFCTKNSLIHARDEIQKRQQMLKDGKHISGKPLTEIEKRVLQKEIDLIQQSLRLPGMKAVEVMQQKTTTFKQALWEHSRLGDCSSVVRDAAQTTLESYPEYEAWKKSQQEQPKLALANTDLQIMPGDISFKSVSISAVTDLTTGRPLFEYYATDSPIRVRFLEIYEEVKGTLPAGPDVEQKIMSEVWNRIEKEGLLDNDAVYFGKRYFYHLAPTNPLEHPQEFATNVAKYTMWWAVNLVATEGMGTIVKTISAVSHLQDLTTMDFSSMTREEKLDFLAQQAADVTLAMLTSKALNKLAPGLKPLISSPSIPVHSEVEPVVSSATQFTKAENTIAVTTDGVPVKIVPEEVPNTLVLKNAAEEVSGSAKGASDAVSEQVEWTSHGFKHKAPPNIHWNKIVKSTRHGDAMYKPNVNIKELELHAWSNGQKTTNGKNWKVFKNDEIIGAKLGKETCYLRVECSANTIHGHPILEEEYLACLK